MKAALIGVPEQEVAEHKKNKDNCLRCGRTGHRCIACYARTTIAGTPLPPMLPLNQVKVASTTKRKGEAIESEALPRKQAQTAAISIMDDSDTLSAWAEESENEDDF